MSYAFAMQVNRGAFLGWLSQYPLEKEILIPPMTGIEKLRQEKLKSGTYLYTMVCVQPTIVSCSNLLIPLAQNDRMNVSKNHV